MRRVESSLNQGGGGGGGGGGFVWLVVGWLCVTQQNGQLPTVVSGIFYYQFAVTFSLQSSKPLSDEPKLSR
jgi:hypothetical protein